MCAARRQSVCVHRMLPNRGDGIVNTSMNRCVLNRGLTISTTSNEHRGTSAHHVRAQERFVHSLIMLYLEELMDWKSKSKGTESRRDQT